MENKNSLKKSVLSLFICIYLFSSGAAEAADLHVLLVGDTTDFSLGHAFQVDMNMMQEEVKKIAQATDLNLKLSLFSGWKVTPENILDHIQNINVNPDDVVIMYFTIHGFRTHDKDNQWPNLFFGTEGRGVDFDLINQIMKEKNPRLLLSIADSCNNFLPKGYEIPTISKLELDAERQKNMQKNYQKLFRETSGSIIISSSIPGQYSWAYVYLGGVYTLQFLDEIHAAVSKAEAVDWAPLLENVNTQVLDLTTKQTDQPQQAQYELILN